MRRRQSLPLVLPVLIALLLVGCAAGNGLRVEGVQAPATGTVSPTRSLDGSPPIAPASPPPTAALVPSGPTPSGRKAKAVSLEAVRQTLLADPRVAPNFRSVLTNCTVVVRCLRHEITADVMHTGHPQQVVTIHTVDNVSFGAFLLAEEPNGFRLVWSLETGQPSISRSKDGDLVVESKVFGQNDQACCPSGSKVEVYRWNGQQLTRIDETYLKGD